ncbi:Sulfotransferase domain containing protein [Trema orientale]|uniref:Sulfotransferase n=1 Tax=Trema orientale TaxID=63057 RepID=A0A2P5EDI7_TREOI|nr:Sulfotransferase domain containing protein [Trema orientale]
MAEAAQYFSSGNGNCSGSGGDDNRSSELVLSQLPKASGWLKAGVTLYQNCWFPSNALPNIISFQKQFKADDQDIILASNPKSGTTWLKALLFSILNRTDCSPSNTPLLTSNPHQLVPSFEFTLYSNPKRHDLNVMSSPRLVSTHIPYSSFPNSIKHSKCRIVYICRNPLDVIISIWHFVNNGHPDRFWKASLEKPEKVLFLKYEDLKEDTFFQARRIAEFVGFPFSKEEECNGVIEQILELCSLSKLKELDVNKHGQMRPNFENKLFFRKGKLGDWVNHLSPSMVERVDKVMKEKLGDSGLSFKMSS